MSQLALLQERRPHVMPSRISCGLGRAAGVALVFVVVVAQAAGVGAEARVAQGTSRENPLEKVPVVGSQFRSDTAVSTAMQCVISLTIQYMVVYTALALVRTAADVLGWSYEEIPIQKTLQMGALTVNYAPMLAILFLAFRMRVNWLTQGKGHPPEWVQVCMYCCTYAVLATTITVCIIPLFTKKEVSVNPKTGDIDSDFEPFSNSTGAIVFTAIKYLILVGLYVGVLCVIYGIYTFEPPKGTWPGDKIPPVSPAVACVMILSCQYFLVYAGVQFAKTISEFSGTNMSSFEEAMLTATNAMNFAPMLGVLFIGARMRALQMDPVNGAPQAWAQNCFYMCTYATLAQVLISIAVPLVLQGKAEVGTTEGDMVYKVENQFLGSALSVGRYVIMLCIYIGFTCVIYSVFTIEHPQGSQHTPPISVTMQCVINLTTQYFFVYLMIWVGVSIKEFTGKSWLLLTNTMESARGTIQFCPMLSILFVGTRMRALWLTDNKGAPQGWVQDGMYMATWAVLLQFLMCLVVPLLTGKPAEIDEDGNVKWEPSNKIALYAVLAVKWITFIFLYGGIIAVIVGVYTMTPETANGRGAVPLLGDGRVPGLDVAVPGYTGVGEPYGPNDIPGVAASQ